MSDERDRLIETTSRLADACFALAERVKQQTGTNTKTNDALHAIIARMGEVLDALRGHHEHQEREDQFQLWLRESVAVISARVKDVDDITGKFATVDPREERRRDSSPPPEAGKIAAALYQFRKLSNAGRWLLLLLVFLALSVLTHPAHSKLDKVLGWAVAPEGRSEDSR